MLGDFQARLGLGAPLSLKRRKTEALLAYCALPPGQRHSRDKLAALLWGDRPLPRARSRLRETLFVLRRALATADPPCLELGRETLAVAADAVDVDAVAFERLVRAGGPEALARAVDLYRGDLLQGLAFRGALFEDWLMDERERLRELALDALAKLLAHQQSSGAAEAAVPTALRLIALDPLQEAAHRTVMRLYAQLGRRGAALRQYQLCVGILLRELGAEPEADTRELYQEILRRRPQRGTSARVSPEIAEHKPFLASPMIATPAIPLIGREGEVTWLRQALAQARAGLGRVGVIVGEAGVGKTRLIAELVAEALPRGARLLLGRCYESDQILPFGPWVDAFRTAGVSSDRRLLAELAPPWRAELARLLPEVDVPGLPEPGDNQLRLFESVGHLLERLTARQPTVVVLEDLHWADEMTLRLLAYVTRRIAPWPLLLMVTAREEDLAEASAAHSALRELGGQLHAGRLTLFPLSRADTRRLTQALARAGTDARAVKRLVQQVWAASEGNPFVAVETTRALQEGSIGGDARTLALPQRVRELIAGQLERLSERAHEIVSVAAVIGREFEFALLERAGGLDEAGAARAVEELVRRRALHGVGERFGFTHERVRAVVYDRLLPPRRKLLHRQVGEAIETVHAEDLEPHYAALGAHYREGEVWDRAASYLGKAGKTALTRFGFREAAAYFEQALAALTHLPETRETREQAIDLRFDLRNALDPLAELGRIEGYLREAEILARALDDQRRLGWALVFMSDHQRVTGSHATAARTFAQRARAIAETLHDVPLEVAAQYYLVTACHTAGDYRGTEDGCRRLMQLLQGDRARERFGAAFPSWCPGAFWRAPSPSEECSTREALTDKKRSEWPKRSITRTVSSSRVGVSPMSTASGGHWAQLAACSNARSLFAAIGASRRLPHSRWGLWGTCTRGRDASWRASRCCGRP